MTTQWWVYDQVKYDAVIEERRAETGLMVRLIGRVQAHRRSEGLALNGVPTEARG